MGVIRRIFMTGSILPGSYAANSTKNTLEVLQPAGTVPEPKVPSEGGIQQE